MRKLTLIFAVVLLSLCSAMPAAAQFRFGIKAGVNVSNLHFDKSTFDSDNRAGFTGGVMAEFTVPLIGVGADLSAMYVRRDAKFMENNNITKNNRDYIEIPLNLKYKLSLPAISHIIAPFVTTGPSISFLTSRQAVSDVWKNKKASWAWNFGFGVQLVKKLQIAASYGIGLDKAMEFTGNSELVNSGIESKNRYWTVTAAYLF